MWWWRSAYPGSVAIRFSRDVEKRLASAEAFLYAASAIILLRRLGRC
jgi:hypothetical protein